MKRLLLVTSLLSSVALAGTARAQSEFDMNQPGVGKQAGTFMIRLRAIGVFPMDSSSSVGLIGGHISTTASAAPEVDFSWFFSDHIAAELIAASTRHTLSADGTALGNIDVGSTWVLPPTLTLQYHFFPHERISPYVGAGVNATMFYATHASAPITGLSVTNSWGPAVQAGVDYNIAGHWFVNFDVKQIFLNTSAHVAEGAVHLKAKDSLNPMVIGLGVGYRF